MVSPQIGKDEMGEDAEKKTEYAIKQAGDRYYPLIIDREAGGHYEIKTLNRRHSQLQQSGGCRILHKACPRERARVDEESPHSP
jgi:hypothetical protein